MKMLIRIILLSLFDFAIIWLWVKNINPDPSFSIGMLLFVPFVVVVNLIIAAILFFKKRELAPLFAINSIISGILMFYLLGKGIDRYQNERYESWKFKIQDKTYTITHWKPESTFSIGVSTNPGSSTGFLDGKLTKRGNKYYLTTDTTEYIIKNHYLYQFRSPTDSIPLIKIER